MFRGKQDYDAGTIDDDDLLHAVRRVGSGRIALCGAGRIRHTLPTPFVPAGDDSCSDCTGAVRHGLG